MSKKFVLLFLMTMIACFDQSTAALVAQDITKQEQPKTAELVRSLRKDFPKRRGVTLRFETKSVPNDDEGAKEGESPKFRMQVELEVNHDLSRMRSSCQVELPTLAYCYEELLMESETLQAAAFGKCNEAGKFQIDPDGAQSLILKESVYPFDRGKNPYLKGGGLYLGLFSGMTGVFDIHDDAFAKECVLKNVGDQLALIHDTSKTTFLFDRESWLLKEIESTEPLVDSQGIKVGEIVQRRVIGKADRKDNAVVQFTLHVKPAGGAMVRTFSTLTAVEELAKDAPVSKFRLLEVKEGSPVAAPNDDTGIEWQFKDGHAQIAVECDVECEIDR